MIKNYTVFTNESYIIAESYRSLAAVSIPTEHVGHCNEILSGLLESSDVQELKWQKLNSAEHGFCVEKIIFSFLRIYINCNYG